RRRTQSSIAVSPDYRRWFLFNASPDVHAQFESFPVLRPSGERVVPVQAVVLTDAELDHTLGLLLLREGRGLELHCTEAVYDTLRGGNSLLRVLEAYCPVKWHPVFPGRDVPLGDGLSYRAFDVPTTKRARFGAENAPGRVVGYRLTDDDTGGTLVYLPGVQELTAAVLEQLEDSSCLLIDGTCWRDEEMILLGLARKTSRDMGHMPVGGPEGSLRRLAP
ncbi:MBL fold metallo-hydrolase, partial [Actinomadura adrarensis]